MRKTWDVYVAGGKHTVELEHGYWSGSRKIFVDGLLVVKSQKLLDTGSVHMLDVGGKAYRLAIGAHGLKFSYELSEASAGLADPAIHPATAPVSDDGQEADVRRMKAGAGWLHWVAGLSVANTVLAFLNYGFNFGFGLELTSLTAAIAAGTGDHIVMLFAAAFNLLVAGVFVLLGSYAVRGRKWAFLAGMSVYALDGLLYLLLFGEVGWITLGFHAFVLYSIFLGLRARNRLGAAGQL